LPPGKAANAAAVIAYPERLAADSAYGSAEILGWLVHERGIEPHIPVYDKSKRADDTTGPRCRIRILRVRAIRCSSRLVCYASSRSDLGGILAASDELVQR
jgi:hypothetical protein